MVRNVQMLLDKMNPNGSGHGIGWIDRDMLEIGNGSMTYDYYETGFTIWCLMKSLLL